MSSMWIVCVCCAGCQARCVCGAATSVRQATSATNGGCDGYTQSQLAPEDTKERNARSCGERRCLRCSRTGVFHPGIHGIDGFSSVCRHALKHHLTGALLAHLVTKQWRCWQAIVRDFFDARAE